MAVNSLPFPGDAQAGDQEKAKAGAMEDYPKLPPAILRPDHLDRDLEWREMRSSFWSQAREEALCGQASPIASAIINCCFGEERK